MSTTLSALRSRVRRYLDESSEGRWSNTDINAYINEGIRFAQAEVDRSNQDYFLRESTFTASAGTTEAALPSTVLGHRIRTIWTFPRSTVATGLPYRVTPGQLEWIFQNQYYSADYPDSYYPYAGYITWAPMLSATATFKFIYAKKEADLSADTDTIDAISDEYTDIVALYAAIMAKEAKDIPTGGLRDLLGRKIIQMRGEAQPGDPIVIPQQGIDD